MYTRATRDYCTAVGNNAQATGTSVGYATAIGENATASGDYSTAVGYGATASGAYSTAIGYGAQATANYSTAIGYGAQATVANTIIFGRATEYVQVPGYIRYDSAYHTSDIRLKNIQGEYVAGLNEIRQIKTYNYTYKKDKSKTPRVGVIAQELQKVFPNAVIKEPKGYLTMRDEDLFYAMINSIKQLDKIVKGLVNDVKSLIARVQSAENKIAIVFKECTSNDNELQALGKQSDLIINQQKGISAVYCCGWKRQKSF